MTNNQEERQAAVYWAIVGSGLSIDRGFCTPFDGAEPNESHRHKRVERAFHRYGLATSLRRKFRQILLRTAEQRLFSPYNGMGLIARFGHWRRTSPRRTASRTASVRFETPSFENSALVCDFTVPSVTARRSAISLFKLPRAISLITSSSRNVREICVA